MLWRCSAFSTCRICKGNSPTGARNDSPKPQRGLPRQGGRGTQEGKETGGTDRHSKLRVGAVINTWDETERQELRSPEFRPVLTLHWEVYQTIPAPQVEICPFATHIPSVRTTSSRPGACLFLFPRRCCPLSFSTSPTRFSTCATFYRIASRPIAIALA